MNTRARLAALIAGVTIVTATPHVSLAQGAYQRPATPQRVPTGSSTSTSKKMSGDEQKAEEVYAKLLSAAQDDITNHQYADGVKAYEQAVNVGESLYGTHDARLVPALSGIVYAQMSWDTYAAMAGGKKGDVGEAVKAQERVVKIYDSDGVDPKERVSSMIDLGDVYSYTGNERANVTYRDAWQAQSKLDSAESADALFAKPAVVRLQLPPNPAGHEEWIATVRYDVGADGKATVSGVDGNQPESLASAIRASYESARFRPRFVGGEPVTTTGLTSSHKYIASK
jgi:hypothetical protein